MESRTARLSRETAETTVSVEIDVDGQGNRQIDTGNGMFNHLLAQFARHGLIDLSISARGDTDVGWHHLVEDTGIMLGRAFRKALGEARGITRMAHAYVPLDEALALVVVDFGGRGYAVVDADIGDQDMAGLPGDLVRHFLETLAREGAFNLHVRLLAGENSHHKAEAIFKALARALRAAMTPDPRLGDEVPSTKGRIG